MLKKFLAGTVAVLAFGLIVSTAGAAYDFGTTTLKIGSKGEAVKAVQTVVGATPVDGIFGKMTAAKVMAWQKANGLTADGLFGKASMAKANGATATTTTTTTTTSTTLKGGAGDSDYSSYSTGVKSSIKDGEEDVKVAGLKIEAIDSDIAVNSIKVQVATSGTTSTKVSKYIESVDIYMGSKKVASEDVADFTKDGTNYYKSITLSNAVVKADEKEAFYVVFNAASDIDDTNDGDDINVDILSYRFTDADGVTDTKDVTYTARAIDLDLVGANDVSLKSSSSNPDASTVTVDENDSTDEILALAFKIDVDEDSTSDASIMEIPVVLTFASNTGETGSRWADQVVESVTVSIDGDEYEAELTTDNTSGTSGTAEYIADVNGDTVVDAGDVVDVKVYITFAEQDGNYAENTTVSAKVYVADVEVEDSDEDSITVTGGDKSGNTLTLNTSAIELSKMSWSSASGANTGTLDFFFTLKAGNDDVRIADEDIDLYDTLTNASEGVLTLISGDASGSSDDYTVSEGDTANFRFRYAFSTDGAEVKITAIKGVTVPDEKQLSPTAYLKN